MPEIVAERALVWAAGSRLFGDSVVLPWASGVRIFSDGSTYVAGDPPPDTVEPNATPLAAGLVIDTRASYQQVHAMSMVDERTGTALPVTSVSISTDEDSIVWSLRAQGPDGLYQALVAGEQPVPVLVDIDGLQWRFVIDSVSRSRAHASVSAAASGRSITAAAGTPYEPEQTWVNDGPTTAAQICAISNTYTGLQVAWGVEDWLIPDRVWTFTGTPLAAVKRVAESIGAVVQSHRVDPEVTVRPRYPLLPNEWPVSQPNVDIALDAVVTEAFERADQPAYNGVYLTGLQQGAVGYVMLAGSSGAVLHPLVTDALLTDEPALRQRGAAILGASGEQARVTATLPVLTGPSEPGVLDIGMLAKMRDPAGNWFGLVRSVSVQAQLPNVSQTVVLERHTRLIDGTECVHPGDPLVFTGPIPDQTATVGVAFSLALASFWSGGVEPYVWTMRSGTLPAGLTLNAATGVVSGTPTTTQTLTGIAFRVTDAVSNQADSNTLTMSAGVPDSAFSQVVLLVPADGVSGSTAFVDRSIYTRTITTLGDAQISTSDAAFPGGALSVANGALAVPYSTDFVFGTGDFTIEFWLKTSFLAAGQEFISFARGSHTERWAVYTDSGAGLLRFSCRGFSSASAGAIADGVRRHVAVTRSGNTFRVFLNGAPGYSLTTPVDMAASTSPPGLTIGAKYGDTPPSLVTPATALIDDVRVTKGLARYTAAFTPPTAPFPTFGP